MVQIAAQTKYWILSCQEIVVQVGCNMQSWDSSVSKTGTSVPLEGDPVLLLQERRGCKSEQNVESAAWLSCQAPPSYTTLGDKSKKTQAHNWVWDYLC